MSLQRHAPIRRLWGCAACAQPWPCEAARAKLVEEYADDPKLLAMDMASCMVEAGIDLAELMPERPDPVALYGRFMGFVRHLAVNRHRNAGHFIE
ncbi:flavin reductase [Micromonospora sp. D93]|uniref:flavin reductase n=1 Tax=Micromonospora sp. D93 TaxID=2824886 RepID=UPI001B372045|nr:flavin reductase [Micromonospora sp. D93]MBQ1017744.1 flavin reductase [Micromonospora sp. D93]